MSTVYKSREIKTKIQKYQKWAISTYPGLPFYTGQWQIHVNIVIQIFLIILRLNTISTINNRNIMHKKKCTVGNKIRQKMAIVFFLFLLFFLFFPQNHFFKKLTLVTLVNTQIPCVTINVCWILSDLF